MASRRPGSRRPFLKDTSGTIAVLAAIAMPVLVMVAGLAVDIVRAYDIRTELQGAADAAALAAASEQSRTTGRVELNGRDYFTANSVPASTAAVTEPFVVHNTTAQTVTVSATATMNTGFMRVAGFDTLDITVSATASYKGEPKAMLELVVAPDVSASMVTRWPDNTVSQAYGIGTTAMSFVINLENQVTKPKLRAGVVPFNSYVKVNHNAIPAGIASGSSIGTVPSCNCYTSCDGVTGTCVSTCEGGRFMCQGGSSVYYGCVGPYDVTQNKAPYPRVYGNCDINGLQMQDLVYEAAYARIALQKTSNSALGPTFIPNGLLWAWNMLTPEIPLTSALPPKDAMKVVLLISDGINTGSPQYPSFPVVKDEGGVFVDAKVNPDTSWLDGTRADQLTRDLCQKMKDYGIIIYTLRVGPGTAASTSLMQDCASDINKSYSVTRYSQLSSTFTAIRTSIATLFQTGGDGGPPYLVK